MPPHQFPVFETAFKKRRGKWSWSVYSPAGRVLMSGAERSRAGASYKANRALFLMLLSAPYSDLRTGDIGVGN
jgi:hypothetical protein